MALSAFQHSPVGLNRIISTDSVHKCMRAAPGSEAHFLGPLQLPYLPSIEDAVKDLSCFFSKHAKSGDRSRIYRRGVAVDVGSSPGFSESENILALVERLDATIYLSGLQVDIPYLADLAACFAIGTHSTISVNAFVSPANVNSTPIHYDYENLIVHQFFGSKVWKFYDHPDRPTFTMDGYKIDLDRMGGVYLNNTLKQHDTVFIPKGTIHHAETSGSASIHFVFNLSPLRDEEIFSALCIRAWRNGANSDARSALPGNTELALADLNRITERTAVLEELARNQLFSAVAKYRKSNNFSDFTGDTHFIASASCLYQRRVVNGRLQVEYVTPLPPLTQIDLASYVPARFEAPLSLVPIFEILERGTTFGLNDLLGVLDEPSVEAAFRLMLKLGFISIV